MLFLNVYLKPSIHELSYISTTTINIIIVNDITRKSHREGFITKEHTHVHITQYFSDKYLLK